MTRFDMQPSLTGPTLSLAPLRADDADGLFAAARDPETWAGHPANTRYLPEVFGPYFNWLLATGSALAIRQTASQTIVGCSRYYVPPDQPDSIGIGFTFLHHSLWGGVANREVKRLMHAHAFATFPQIWFHIAPSNIRSQKATAKLGAVHAYDATLSLMGDPADWMCYVLTREAWAINLPT